MINPGSSAVEQQTKTDATLLSHYKYQSMMRTMTVETHIHGSTITVILSHTTLLSDPTAINVHLTQIQSNPGITFKILNIFSKRAVSLIFSANAISLHEDWTFPQYQSHKERKVAIELKGCDCPGLVVLWVPFTLDSV